MKNTIIGVLTFLFPLAQYIDEENPGRTIKIKFKYYTYDKDGSPIESDKYCDPGFDYTPGQN